MVIFKKNKLLNSYGFTLLELLITLAISSIILTAIYNLFISQSKIYLKEKELSKMEQNLRASLDIMSKELRKAGYNPNGNASVGIDSIGSSNSSIQFSFVSDQDGEDNDNDNSTDENNEIEIITYDLYDSGSDGDNDIGRKEYGDNRQAIAYDISDLKFTNNNGTIDIFIKASSSRKDTNDLRMNKTVVCRNLCLKN